VGERERERERDRKREREERRIKDPNSKFGLELDAGCSEICGSGKVNVVIVIVISIHS
jgi:hypothetical protein